MITAPSRATGSIRCTLRAGPLGVTAPRSETVRARTRAAVTTNASASAGAADVGHADRRAVLAGLSGVCIAELTAGVRPAMADEEEGPYKRFFGLATPPTSYGGYGGNAKEQARYTFEYPVSWKEEVPSKSEKGYQGVDGRVVAPKGGKDLRAFVITLGRAGEDGKNFVLRDTEATFAGFAGADYNLLDSLSVASNIEKDKVTNDGIDFFTFDIDSPDFRYLSSIAVKDGKVYALFTRCPSKLFKQNEEDLRHIISSFRLL